MNAQTNTGASAGSATQAATETLTVIDNRTGKHYELPIKNGTIRANDLRQIRTDETDFGIMSYDPAFMNTASCTSRITYIDGDAGILEYRGYPIEQLAEKSSFLETAYLTVHGELPTASQLAEWTRNITNHTMVPEPIKGIIDGYHHDAHPMGMLMGAVGALGTFYPDSHNIFDAENRMLQTYRLIAKVPTIAAYCYRHTKGLPYVDPDDDLSYTGNFLSMLFRMTERQYKPNPVLEKALDLLFILHADHEQNCSTNAVRAIGSSEPDPYAAITGGIGALYGPLHGGANEAVLNMLREIGSKENIPAFIDSVKHRDKQMMGFGHRVYKNYDPRARIVKATAEKVFEVTGRNPLIDIAVELERIALEEDYFITRKLYPNVDFYSGIIYEAMGLPSEMFTVLFAIARTVGWMAQWLEMVEDPEQKIARPRQIFLGPSRRDYVEVGKR